MIRAIHDLFSELTEAVWMGILYGIAISTALTVVFFCLRVAGVFAAAVKAVAP